MSKVKRKMLGVEERLNALDTARTIHYESLIKIHNNKSLRALCTSLPMNIIIQSSRAEADSDKSDLYFGINGFYANVPKCVDPGNYAEPPVYHDKKYAFRVEKGTLVARTHKGTLELLALFPNTSHEEIEGKVIKEIDKLPIMGKSVKN